MATVEWDNSEIEAICADWGSSVGDEVALVTAAVYGVAKALAPVSRTGSKYAPPGYLKTRVAIAHKTGDTGEVLGLVGVPLHAGSRYPLDFVDNVKGRTRNPHGRGSRAAANRFLQRALAAVAG